MDLSPAVGHVRECPHSGTRYYLNLFFHPIFKILASLNVVHILAVQSLLLFPVIIDNHCQDHPHVGIS